MGKQFDALAAPHIKFITAQHIFFVATAASDGRVNVSPKGMDSLRVMAPDRIVWRNLTGSGNETAGHLASVNRMTLMWCGFERQAMIMRAYGTAQTLHVGDDGFDALNAMFFNSPGARQIYDMQVEMVQTSCGYAVPFYDYVEDRQVLQDWAKDKGTEGVRSYWRERNQKTLDGKPTHVPVSEA